jgi:hypothetical protein
VTIGGYINGSHWLFEAAGSNMITGESVAVPVSKWAAGLARQHHKFCGPDI